MQLAVMEVREPVGQPLTARGFLGEMAARHARARLHLSTSSDASRLDRGLLLKLLNEALASEIACMLRYRRHFFMVRGTAQQALMAELLDRANEEQRHADLIAERIVQLGGEPDLSPLHHCDRETSYAEDSSVADMVSEELAAERIAIEAYGEMLRFIGHGDPVTRRLLEDILAEETGHAGELASRLEALRGN